MKEKKEAAALGWLFVAAIVLFAATSLGFNLLFQKGISPSVEASLVMSEFPLIICGLCYVLFNRLSLRDDLGFRPVKVGTILVCIVLSFLILPTMQFVNLLSQLFTTNTALEVSDQLQGGSVPVVFILLSLYGPFVEEFFFRSLMCRRYEIIAGPFRAGLISAVLFGLMHMNINQASYSFVFGFILAVVNKAAGSVYPSVIIHMMINGINAVKILSPDDSDQIADAAAVLRESETFMSNDIWILLGYTLVVAVVCAFIAIPCIAFIAGHEKRLDKLKDMFTKKHPHGGWLSFSLILGTGIALFFLFGLKPLLELVS